MTTKNDHIYRKAHDTFMLFFNFHWITLGEEATNPATPYAFILVARISVHTQWITSFSMTGGGAIGVNSLTRQKLD